MDSYKKIVLECLQKVLDEKGIKKKAELNMKCNRENGMDSLGIVSLILNIEEEINCDLDNVLANIRRCENVYELVEIVVNEVEK